ncbi:hypothetical protein SAMN05443507_12428 [Alicyclobacillus tolerans]|uniref:Dolichyl-phosphate-mannose-protein mannosyltransferase n=2 Tax=Alicyclobacillus tolerans TaxID=90970 RepID=A0A1M6VT24_9BACL|nr:hypothetical protein SAMN05443507_12428 [Alicyclobacillus montanus]
MNCLLMIMGYVLVVFKIFAGISVLACLFGILVFRLRRAPHRTRLAALGGAFFYSSLESQSWWVHLRQKLRKRWAIIYRDLRRWHFSHRTIELFAFWVVFVLSVYIRSYDALVHAAPSMSDGYTTLTWAKYIDMNQLFHDGIYPQGFYIYIALIGKLALVNLLYILKYSGAFNNSLVVWSIYYTLKNLTGKANGALVGMALYGVFGYLILQDDWSRVGASLSQEFSFVFALPVLVFAYKYLKSGRPEEGYTVFFGLSAAGLTHPFGYALALLCAGSPLLAEWLVQHLRWNRKMTWMTGAILASLFVTLWPLAVGRLLGHAVNAASVTFIHAHQAIPFPQLTWLDILGAACSLFLCVIGVLHVLRGDSLTLSIALAGLLMFTLYEWLAPLSQSVALSSRAIDMWAIIEALVIGYTVYLLLSFFPVRAWWQWTQAVGIYALFQGAVAFCGVNPIIPYKLLSNHNVEQYLQIVKQQTNGSYLLVAPDQYYSLVLDTGYLMHVNAFVHEFNPKARIPLTAYGAGKPSLAIPHDVYIIYPKHLYEINSSLSIYPIEKKIYQQDELAYRNLAHWLRQYQSAGHSLQIEYDGPNTTVYLIYNNK